MRNLRTSATLLLGLALVSGATLAASAEATGPARAADAAALLAAIQASDGSHASLQAVSDLLASQREGLTPEQAARVAAAGPVAPNHGPLARDVAAIHRDATLDPVAQGFRIAAAATRAQADALGVALAPAALAGHRAPGAALRALADHAGVALTADDLAQLDALDALPADQALALARVVDAYVAMDAAAQRAIADDPARPDWGATLAARLAFLEAVEDLRLALPETPSTAVATSTYALYNVDLSGASTVYTTNYAFSLDVGGNDEYRNNAGGNWLGNCGVPTTAAAAIDILGDDTYAPAYYHNPGDPYPYADACGKNGGSQGGVGLLLDVGGRNAFGAGQSYGVNGGAYGTASLGALLSLGSDGDSFRAGDLGTNGGAASGGVALLVGTTLSGNSLSAGSLGTNGGAWRSGLGMLIDTGLGSGYNAWSEGTNGGATGLASVGFAYGSGSWSAGSYGTNGGGHDGGAGTLVATGGSVRGDSHGTGGGADGIGSTGALYGSAVWDYEGDDSGTLGGGANGGHGTLVDPLASGWFDGGSYGSLGGAYGIGSAGFLYAGLGGTFQGGSYGVTGGGHSTGVGLAIVGGLGGSGYAAGSRGVNGGATQAGVGALLDAGIASADYTAGQYGVNGGGDAGGDALLLDAGGNDLYSASSFGANGAGDAQGHGALIDLSGNDVYACPGYSCNGAATVPGSTGLLLDVQGSDTYNGQPNQTTPLKGSGFAGNQIDVSPI